MHAYARHETIVSLSLCACACVLPNYRYPIYVGCHHPFPPHVACFVVVELAVECKKLVNKVRECAKNVLMCLLGLEEETRNRPGLLRYLSGLLDTFLDKRLTKAEEVVDYLSKAELSKRYTQDPTYERIKTKVRYLAEEAHTRLTTVGGHQPPPEQVVAKGTDEDVQDIAPDFIVSFYRRAVEQNANNMDEMISKMQVRLLFFFIHQS